MSESRAEFTTHQGIRRSNTNLFFAQTSRVTSNLQTSSVPVEGSDVFKIVEQYCAQSDQQPVRLFHGPEGRVALVSAFRDTARIARLVAELYKDAPGDLFRGDPRVEVECPRCAAKHMIAREAFDAALSAGASEAQ